MRAHETLRTGKNLIRKETPRAVIPAGIRVNHRGRAVKAAVHLIRANLPDRAAKAAVPTAGRQVPAAVRVAAVVKVTVPHQADPPGAVKQRKAQVLPAAHPGQKRDRGNQ